MEKEYYTYEEAKNIDCAVETVQCTKCNQIGEMVYLQGADLWTCQICGWDNDN